MVANFASSDAPSGDCRGSSILFDSVLDSDIFFDRMLGLYDAEEALDSSSATRLDRLGLSFKATLRDSVLFGSRVKPFDLDILTFGTCWESSTAAGRCDSFEGSVTRDESTAISQVPPGFLEDTS